ncbi:MAG: hypothetical protein WCD53_22130 [Microcoleus sp.]
MRWSGRWGDRPIPEIDGTIDFRLGIGHWELVVPARVVEGRAGHVA